VGIVPSWMIVKKWPDIKGNLMLKKKKYIFTAHMSIKPWRVLSTIEIHCLTMSCG
jgi:hypothetical protein